MDKADNDQRGGGKHHRSILPRIGKRVRTGTQQHQEWIPHDQQETADDCSRNQGYPEAERADTPRFLRAALAEQPGDQGASALPEDIAESHQDHEDRCADRNAGNQQGIIRLRDKIGVSEIIENGNDRT